MRKIIVGITGASGSIYAQQLLNKLTILKSQGSIDKIGVVMSNNAKDVWQHELQNDLYTKYDVDYYERTNFYAPFASGSAKYDTLIICPCSMGTMARIAHGISDDLITRAADVILKERRKLILVVRDTPYNLIHIENMRTLTLAGGTICPASPSYYSIPKTIEELANTVVDRALDLANFSINTYRWNEK